MARAWQQQRHQRHLPALGEPLNAGLLPVAADPRAMAVHAVDCGQVYSAQDVSLRVATTVENQAAGTSDNNPEAMLIKLKSLLDAGVLTPEEFIEAGDQLVFKFPTWQWATCPKDRRVSYLPEDKQ